MSTTTQTLELVFTYPDSGDDTPVISVLNQSGERITCITTRVPLPDLPISDASIEQIDALDVLEHIHDEQAWIGEFHRVLVPGGSLTLRVPLENWMAWADALNISRYVADVTGVGEEPPDTVPTGWHRHYEPGDIPALLKLAGFDIKDVSTQGTPVMEIPQLAALLAGNIRGNHRLQQRVGEWIQSRRHQSRMRLPAKVASTITVRAKKAGDGFAPDPDLDPDVRPELDSDQSLE